MNHKDTKNRKLSSESDSVHYKEKKSHHKSKRLYELDCKKEIKLIQSLKSCGHSG
jgi:hypothetical protein